MNKAAHNLLIKVIHWWEASILSRPWPLLIITLVACGYVGKYAYENLTVNTNTADMLSIELPFQKNRIRLEHAFPQDVSTILLLVEGPTPELTSEATKRLGEKLRAHPDSIKSIYQPDEGGFFERNGMLYLSLPELQKLSEKLSQAQPFIGRLSQDNSLHGLLGILSQAIEAKDDDLALDLDPVLARLNEAIEAVRAGQAYQLSWQQLMLDQKDGLGVTKRFIFVTPILNFSEMLPAEQSIAAIDSAVAETLTGDLARVQAHKTGEVVLEHEEMQTIGQGTAAAGVASMILVCITLWIAYRSFRLMFATFLTLTLGLVFSMGFAAYAIGHLNLISIAFAVLFIGMGDAFSSHFCLRYRELILRGESQRDALRDTLTSTGTALILCAITAAIGLYAFIPTNYIGVSELGMIAGTSMIIALITTFTVLPAIMNILPLKPPRASAGAHRRTSLLSNWPLRYARPIRWISAILTVLACVLLARVQVDFNPINLRDPNTESVKTFKYLLQSRDTSPMTLASLARSEAEARDKQARFEQLPTVDKVESLFDFIPADQDEKLALIEELGLVLGTRLAEFPAPATGNADWAAVEKFRAVLATRLSQEERPSLRATLDAVDGLLEAQRELPAEDSQAVLDRLQTSVLSALPATINTLKSGLDASPVERETLPADIVDRWLSKDGLYRIQVFPKKDLNDLENLREFILEAQKIDPEVTDLPVTYLESMNEAVKAFVEAFTIALGAITLLLLIILRSVKDTLLVLLPLLLASLFTAAGTVVFHTPLNFANIIALPLLFGLGVDSGIHMAHRLHYLHSEDENLLSTSEAQGVFYGSLTTVFSFASLAFTPHPGTASMGFLLALGLFMTLLCSLVVLPAFSALKLKHRRA
ncbi:MMPL family transporter [Methylococcus sp. EFPC2]|uniref:MMPL family transporter n=1 Tax=Methylococcus sp. EFPC2 TaxID=2812648 RepID=UPI001967BA78|nr:MMPL family transporter [Methylococcus sp. EFPC2]QSA97107.1 MMPL family transporter [Methylococcus sp. EFPC2]